ncbi:MAG: translation initiation factor IF-2 N-terminal domain-containing protein, partial [Winogradskyella sp.]
MAQTRLNKVLRELNISIDRAVDFLESKGVEIEKSPNTKISQEVYDTLSDEFQTDATKREKAQEVSEAKLKEKEELRVKREREIEEKQKKQEVIKEAAVVKAKAELSGPKQVGKIDLDNKPKVENKEEPKVAEVKQEPKVEKKEAPKVEKKEAPKKEVEAPKVEIAKVEKVEKVVRISEIEKAGKQEAKKPAVKAAVKKEEPVVPTEPAEETLKTQYKKLTGPVTTGKKIDLSQFNKPKKKKEDNKPAAGDANKRKRRRISKAGDTGSARPNFDNRRGGGKGRPGAAARPKIVKEEPTEEDVQKQIRETLEKLQGKSNKGKGAKYRREKRDQHRQQTEVDQEIAAAESKTIKVTEFVTVSEMATMMEVGVTQVISACMSLGMMVTMNQRLDAETLTIVAEEFGYGVEFITADIEESIEDVIDDPKDLIERAPIVTVMGHVDHGKTSLLDYIRQENVIAGESGGITQHIGAYGVELEGGQKIAFLDTPGHEAFTAMRARGAQVTDIAIIVVAADDAIMPQTKEAISHAQAAGVPIVFAINKIDKPDANPEKVKEGLAQMNLLVEDWGGKIQSHDISAKMGTGVKELLEKVLLEAELLELKANPNKPAVGTVVEAYLDKGRGYVSTILVQAGTLKVGDYVLAGKNS